MKRIFIVALTVHVGVAALGEELDLAGEWRLSSPDEVSIDCPISVPGDVQSALLAMRLIPDPYFGRNESKIRWVGERIWTLTRQFAIGADILLRRAVVLRMEDVDTFAQIYVNDNFVGSTFNRFRRWEFDVKPYLKEGENEIRVTFESAHRKAEELAATYDHVFPLNTTDPRSYKLNHTHIRKPACHGGWDWGPILMTTGLCGEVKLIAFDDCKVDYVYSAQEFTTDFSHCRLTVFAEVTTVEGRAVTVTNRFEIPRPPLWWPNGAGPQEFYTYEIVVGSQKIRRRIGLRKIDVVTTPDLDGKGSRFAFRVNGRELFMKGANWIPCDALENRQTPERYRDLLGSAVTANMNMLRLWGGGKFEKDVFYDLCDEYGLLLWHDFMFACAVYPGDERFLGNVREELHHQLRRLRDHASIAFWCGDNECVGALGWFKESIADPDYYRRALETRHAVCAAAVMRYDSARMFWPSSPCAGPGDYSDNWTDDSRGDMHNWDVWFQDKPFEAFAAVRPRFSSEFGYQSYPSPDVARTFVDLGNLNLTAPDFEYHQKDTRGNLRIVNRIFELFRFPSRTEDFLYLSQVQQAMAIKTAVEEWRALRPRCMGALYWQLNDVWPVASCSSIEYGGKWKPLHYHARRFFAPLAVAALSDGTIAAYNDTAVDMEATVQVERWTFNGEKIGSRAIPVLVPADGVRHLRGSSIIPPETDEATFLVLMLKTAKGEFSNVWVDGAFKRYDLPKATVRMRCNGFRVTLESDRPAFFVWLNAHNIRGEFTDNCFTLLPGRQVSVIFRPQGSVTESDFRKALTLVHLRETYR